MPFALSGVTLTKGNADETFCAILPFDSPALPDTPWHCPPGQVCARGKCACRCKCRRENHAAPLRMNLIWKMGLISIWTQQLGYFIRITIQFPTPVEEEQKHGEYRERHSEFSCQ